jgi:hypothetical protein
MTEPTPWECEYCSTLFDINERKCNNCGKSIYLMPNARIVFPELVRQEETRVSIAPVRHIGPFPQQTFPQQTFSQQTFPQQTFPRQTFPLFTPPVPPPSRFDSPDNSETALASSVRQNRAQNPRTQTAGPYGLTNRGKGFPVVLLLSEPLLTI